MQTPVYDFITEYISSGTVRFHMPGHKGKNFLGCEIRDITEISGADALYEADGIIRESEANATALFGTACTLYATEGSSQCIRAMSELVRRWWQGRQKAEETVTKRPVILAARNAHKAFLYAAVLLDFDIVWLWPEEENASLCSCVVTPETLEKALDDKKGQVAAVYLTSPNYLGGLADIKAVSAVCHKHKVLLCVDNAHGAYLHFLENSVHPMDCGADLCCDSAHKTLPVLTGGAYLHISKTAPEELKQWGKSAMELFGSTSPSYLILQSLDVCNRYLADGYSERLKKMCERLEQCKAQLGEDGWQVEPTDPLRLTIKAPGSCTGAVLAQLLRKQGVECEFADADYLVLMITPENTVQDLERVTAAFGQIKRQLETQTGAPEVKKEPNIPLVRQPKQVLSVREAYFSCGELVAVEKSIGKICRMPTASCPPAIPVVVPGEKITEEAVRSMQYYGIEQIEIVKCD